jgi:hypothetical protein
MSAFYAGGQLSEDRGGAADECVCCGGSKGVAIKEIFNRPGLRSLKRRIGTHSSFKDGMINALSKNEELCDLRTRDGSDPTIAVLDSWAMVGDILTFYMERICNESYLGTAEERLSVINLSRLIGRRVRPGVAASVYLAFTAEDAPGSPSEVVIEKGTLARSVPAQGETAVAFETLETITARPEWNSIKPLASRMRKPNAGARRLFFSGLSNNLSAGDHLLIMGSTLSSSSISRIASVTMDLKGDRTEAVQEGAAFDPADSPSNQDVLPSISITQLRDAGDEFDEELVRSCILGHSISQDELFAYSETKGWDLARMRSIVSSVRSKRERESAEGVFVMRQRAGIFGHNAPSWHSLPRSLRYDDAGKLIGGYYSNWEDRSIVEDAAKRPDQIDLDAVYKTIVIGSYIAIQGQGESGRAKIQILRVMNCAEVSRSDYGISQKVTRLYLSSKADPSIKIREATVICQSEPLMLASYPIEGFFSGRSLALDGFYPGLRAGMAVIISGEDAPGSRSCEQLIVSDVQLEDGLTVLSFSFSPSKRYRMSTISIAANVALASHGESVEEVLGGGDGAKSYQRFTLRQGPVTFVRSMGVEGSVSSLEVRVNGLLWKEEPSIYGCGPLERVYCTMLGDDGMTTILFGDGITGSRLPTGRENVHASYRKGLGVCGHVKAGQITTLLSRPPGLREVTNPLPSEGGQDMESLDEARRNAPLEAKTFGRIVSLQDFEDFAATFPGIAKAHAAFAWDGEKKSVLVTVAAPGGIEVQKAGCDALLSAIRAAGGCNVPVRIKPHNRAYFTVSAAVKVDPDRIKSEVLAEVERRLRDQFSFAARQFCQAVHKDEVMTCIQSAKGVLAVRLNGLYRSSVSLPTSFIKPEPSKQQLKAAVKMPVNSTLPAREPGMENGVMRPAEILIIDPSPIVLEEMQ